MLYLIGTVPPPDSIVWKRAGAKRIEGALRGDTTLILLKLYTRKRESQIRKAISDFYFPTAADQDQITINHFSRTNPYQHDNDYRFIQSQAGKSQFIWDIQGLGGEDVMETEDV